MKVPYTKCGKCGDTVWQRNRYGQISYKAFIPRNPRTLAQLFVRASFGDVSKRWRTLTEAQRLLWMIAALSKRTRRRLGQRWPMKGFNYFVQVNVALVNRGWAQVDVPPGDNDEPRPPRPLISYLLFLHARGWLTDPSLLPPEFTTPPPPASG
jgi:hypothetical protein